VNRFSFIALTWISFAAMFAVNALANYLPINGYTTGALSALYPNLFVPDGFTFSIWSIIYLWLLAFVGYTTSTLIWLPPIDQRYQRVVSILPLFWVTCLLNAAWILAWHYLQVFLSVVVMVLLLITLIAIFGRIQKQRAHPRKRDHLLAEVPFIVYMGWISVATIANSTALLVKMGYGGAPFSEATWSIIMMIIAMGLGIWMSVRHHRPSYAMVVCWALWGIQRGQGEANERIGWVAFLTLAICMAWAIPEFAKPKKGYIPAEKR
jgi:translocator protein